MMSDVNLRRRYVIDPSVPGAPMGHVGLTVGGTSGAPPMRWSRVVCTVAVMLTVGMAFIYVSLTNEINPKRHDTQSFESAKHQFTKLIHSIQSNPVVPSYDDNRTLCTPVEDGKYMVVNTLMKAVLEWTNTTCFTPLYVGVSVRGVAWGKVGGPKYGAMNIQILHLGYEQSMVLESCPMWDLPAVAVQRPDSVQIRYTDLNGEKHTMWVRGETAHCVQSAYNLWSGRSVHDDAE